MSFNHPVMNAPERPEYGRALSSLHEILTDLPPKIVVIDGAPNVGKTTLGRFLAWRFNVSLIETDLFLIRGQGRYEYRYQDVAAVISSRMERKRPAIVEGVVALRLLERLELKPAFHIHVTSKDIEAPERDDWNLYVTTYRPAKEADLVLELPVIQ